MSVPVLTILKLALLVLLYLFLLRAIRSVVLDLYGPSRRRRAAPPPRPAVADASQSQGRRGRRRPRELVIHPPDGQPEVVPLDSQAVTIGRGEHVTVKIDDVYVSDEHTAVVPDEDGWLVRDLGSTNGTYLNGGKVTQATPVTAGDQLRLGKTRVEVRR